MIVGNKKASQENNRDLKNNVAFLYVTVGNAQCAKIRGKKFNLGKPPHCLPLVQMCRKLSL